MAEETRNEGNGAAEPAQTANAIKMQVVGQYIRDLSFENIVAQKAGGGDAVPEINVQVSLDAQPRAESIFDVTSKYTVTAKKKGAEDTLFLLELQYSGIFRIENLPAEQMHPFLLIECPRLLFPFARRIIHDIVRDGGFPPLNLDNIDWVALYRQNMARLAEAQKAKPETAS